MNLNSTPKGYPLLAALISAGWFSLVATGAESARLSSKERAYIHYDRGTVDEARHDRAAAVRHFAAAYRMLPEHPLIRAKMEELRVQD